MEKFKKFFMIMAIAILAAIVMPKNAFANTVVTEVRISTSQVKHGGAISGVATVDSTVPAGAINSLDLVWLVSDNSSGMPLSVAIGTFEGGKYYAWGFDHLDMNSDYIFVEGVTKYYINDIEYETQTFVKVEKVAANITIYDPTTANRGKFSIANDVNSDKPESTSALSVDLAKDSTATLYVTPESDYAIEKIIVDGDEVSFVYDDTAAGEEKPYKTEITMDSDKNIIVYFRDRKTVKYELAVVKKDDLENKISKDTDKTEFVEQKKQEFGDELNEFEDGKTNVTSLSDDVINSLFTDNTYAVITGIEYKNSSYQLSDNSVVIGDLSNWDNLEVDQGWIEKTDNYEVEYAVYTLTEEAVETTKKNEKIDNYQVVYSVYPAYPAYGLAEKSTEAAEEKQETDDFEEEEFEEYNLTEVTNEAAEEKQESGDGIIWIVIIGGILLVGLGGFGVYIKRRKE